MSDSRIHIKRYPNRRYYARQLSKYVSLQEIEEMIQDGETVEIRDSQTGEDLTRTVLTQIIAERHPDKMELFPTDMLHFILRSNDAMSGFLRDYFRHSLTYLEYLHRHNPSSATLSKPIHWLQTWLDTMAPMSGDARPAPSSSDDSSLREQLHHMDERLRRLEERND